ncbi:DUF4097 family beta strand repeat-containing protein [Roseisolibacter sp. H3M3-2]|uniref:DUF4097 family beta strand repeat-containing protein n=1 Tax=Roseisolibacter sp. H3M3-2 TaxID=3031323 RepID=UPI0023DB7CB2|nr:DUF4097 family beta strand repeat-containing protein [Roseisolibacter sp. H3M3-2]MDF1504999.1 hypothetical protein [Roseisolibacter sp. H3M3-2]
MPSPRLASLPIALALVALAGCDADSGPSRTEQAFRWAGEVPAGGWVRVRDLNGSVRVARAPGREVVITATRRWRGRRPQEVRFVAERDGGNVTACALWGGRGECSAEHYGGGERRRGWFQRLFDRRASVSVDYLVALPAGVGVDARTVNGRVIVADVASEVVARTTNGSIVLGAAGGRVDAQTVNGSVRARLDGLPAGARVALRTVNGSVTALLPEAASAEVALKTVNGRVKSEFPVQVSHGDRRSLRGTLNGGQARVALETVNGSVTLGRL